MRRLLVALAAASLVTVPAVGSATASSAGAADGDKRVCAAAPTGFAACHAHVRTKGGSPAATATWGGNGYATTQLRSAYKLTTINNTATVAIVDAYANPNVASDLARYRLDTGLPALTTGQFQEYGQNGGGRSAGGNTGWGQEEMLDLEMVSAICPTCNIAYVGANDNSFANLSAAVDFAASLHPAAISNSYGGGEFNGEASLESHYHHTGIAVTVSSGDNGYGVEFPAASQYVTAVGGTSLRTSTNARGWTETAWSGAGSGCSSYIAKPGWQHDSSCSTRRTVADVSADADPATGVAVYDSYGSTGGNNWYVFGGTSVAAPIIATVYALSSSTAGVPASIAYANTGSLFDVTSGSNGRCVRGKTTTGAYLCTAGSGYDGPTGLGTPNGTGAF